MRDWIIAHDATKGADAYMMECLRCGAVERFSLPISVTVYCAAAKAFVKRHKACKERVAVNEKSGEAGGAKQRSLF